MSRTRSATGIAVSLIALSLGLDVPSGAAIRFSEPSDRAGITIETTNGDPARKYIIETCGSGVGLLDYDLDGDLDVYVANGSSLEAPSAGAKPVAALYRNDGHGRFTDVTAGSRLAEPFWGFGVAAGDYDNDG